MGGQTIYEANPPPDPSQLPEEILNFRVQLNTQNVLSPEELHSIQEFRRAADYIAAGAPHYNHLHD
jgi:xylulose-5-phosphate/fructose-6-phosphate phosphoketolase